MTEPSTFGWDPAVYGRYAEERGRPFDDLLARVAVPSPRYVVDLGCGPGNLTARLARRWPETTITGVDSSPDMLRDAAKLATDRLSFVEADIRDWRPDRPIDVVIANAVLQWVPGSLDVLTEAARWLAPGGAVAVQVPDNYGDSSHVLLTALRNSPRWRDRLANLADWSRGVERPERFLDTLVSAGLDGDVWQTTYLHVLHGRDPVLDWMSGTGLRPVLDEFGNDSDDRDAFLAEYAEALRGAYPASDFGTVFPFRRTLAVGHLRQVT